MGKFSRSSPQPPRRRADSSEQVRTPSQQTSNDPQLFRRNRTLTGSPSSYVRGVAERAGQLKSGRVQAHELTHVRRKLGGSLFVTAAIALFLLFVILQFTAHIAISTPGVSQPVESDRYAKSIEEYLKYRPIERLRIFTKTNELTAHVMHDAPEVSAVRVAGGGGFATSVFEITIRKPLAAWTILDKRYFVDEKGVSFEKNVYGSDDSIINIIDESGIPVESGAAIASNRFLGYVGRVIGSFHEQGVNVEKVAIPAATTRQIEVTPAGKGYVLRLSIDRPVGEQVEDAVRTLRYIDAAGITPQYVDVRVSRKAFYKE